MTNGGVQMSKQSERPIIVAFVADLMFGLRIEKVAEALGFEVRNIGSGDELGEEVIIEDERFPAERLFGRLGALLDKLTRWQPALLIFDLSNESIPWRQWLPRIKSSPATKRIPVLCYGAHVDAATLREARRMGADLVVPRSRFASALPELIERQASLPDRAALLASCQEPLPDLVLAGLEKMNRGQYYPAHDDLEAAWVADDSPARDLYRGILQITVAYYQLQRGNYNGAAKMFLRARQWLDPLPDECQGVNVAQLREDAEAVYQAMVELGPERVDEIDSALFRPVIYRETRFG